MSGFKAKFAWVNSREFHRTESQNSGLHTNQNSLSNDNYIQDLSLNDLNLLQSNGDLDTNNFLNKSVIMKDFKREISIDPNENAHHDNYLHISDGICTFPFNE